MKRFNNYKLFDDAQVDMRGWYSVDDKSKPVTAYPHYSDRRLIDNKIHVFGGYNHDNVYGMFPADSNAYSDRLYQWDKGKDKEARNLAREKHPPAHNGEKSTLYYEAYLSHYYGRPVEMVQIIGMVNASNGYPLAFFSWNWLD